jgi:hypothetical protein
MILEKQTNSIIHEEGETQDSIGMSLDLDSAQILMQMLSKNLYSDSIGSTIRECASNALDSHRRAGVTKPIIVSFNANERDGYEFSVEDFGIGLDADDVKNIISKYGKSTKRNSSTELGMMGLGFKAPLAYSSSFYFICRKNGMERKYMMYEGEDVNTIDLLYEQTTTEGNGVKVIVPVKHIDKREFIQKIEEQLAYFQNVYFNCGDAIDNNFTIFRTELFQFSELSSDDKLHLCLDDVYYPIDFQKLGINKIVFPVAIRLSLTDGVFPTPNRESIRYTKEAKEILLARIEKIADYFVEKYNENVEEVDNVKDIFDFYSTNIRHVDLGGKKKDISELLSHSNIKVKDPKMKGIELLNLQDLYKMKYYIFGEYRCKYRIESGKLKECKRTHDTNVSDKHFSERVFIFNEKLSGKKKDYIKYAYGKNTGWGNRIYIVKKSEKFKLGKPGNVDYETYMYLLGLNKIPKNKWRQAIQEFNYVVESFFKGLGSLNIDEMQIPQDWLDSRKKAGLSGSSYDGVGRKVKLKGEIICKQAHVLERWVEGKNCKWVSTTYKLEDIHKEPSLIVYGKEADTKVMDELFKIVDFRRCSTKIKFVYFSEREFANLQKVNVHNWITLSEFMKGENKPFKRLVTAYLIEKLVDQNEDVFCRRDQLADISKNLSDKLNVLYKYKNMHCEYADQKIYEAMLEVAEANNAFDHEIYPIYKQVKALLEKLSFLQPMCGTLHGYSSVRNQQIINAITDLFKYYKQRIDWKNYNIKLNEEVVSQPITEEEVEALA